MELRIPRDRQGEFESQWLPERKGQDAELEAFLAEAFLAGLSTRDLARISEKHLGQKYDSKQVSRIVARATTELEAWRQRSLKGQRYKFLYLNERYIGTNDSEVSHGELLIRPQFREFSILATMRRCAIS